MGEEGQAGMANGATNKEKKEIRPFQSPEGEEEVALMGDSLKNGDENKASLPTSLNTDSNAQPETLVPLGSPENDEVQREESEGEGRSQEYPVNDVRGNDELSLVKRLIKRLNFLPGMSFQMRIRKEQKRSFTKNDT